MDTDGNIQDRHHDDDTKPVHIVFDKPLHVHVHSDAPVTRAIERLNGLRRLLHRSTSKLKSALGHSAALSLENTTMSTNPNALDTAIDELVTEVAESSTIIESATAYIKGVPALIQAGIDAAIADGVNPAQLARITEAKDKLSAETDGIVAALQPPVGPAGKRRK